MSKFLDSTGLTTLWDIIKSLFASSLSFSNRTLTLKNKKGDTLSTVELPYRGIYFVKGTQTAATGAWKGALPEVESLYDGLTIAYFLPYAGSGNATLTLTLGSGVTAAEPVYYNNESRATTNYGKGATVILTWVSNATTGYTAVGSALGRWTRADYSSNTIPTAYCTTAAGTADKTASCTNYNLLSNSFVPVLIQNSNTSASAITMNINSKGKKPIYINGVASSANNYTLPAGTYLVFYDGTNYYFNTDGTIHGHLPLSGGTMTGPLSWKNSTALPAKTSDINYLLTIDNFSDGGTTKYATIANVANAIAPTVETAVENDYIMMTKKSDMVIPANSDLDTYKTPGYFICDSNVTAKTISNNPTRLFNSSGAVSGAYGFVLIVRKVTNTTFHQFIYMHQPTGTSERSRVPSSWQRYFNGSAWTNWYKISSVLSNPYPTTAPTSIDFESSEQGLGGMFHFMASDTNRGSLYQMSNILQMNWSADSGYDSQLAVGYTGRLLGFRSRAASGGWNPWNYAQFIHYGVCNSAADVQLKQVDFGNCSIDIPGTEVTVKFVNGNTHTQPKLATSNISPIATFSAGVDIFYKGTFVDQTYIKPNDVVRMVWDGTRWNIVGSINSVTSYGNHIRYYINCYSGSDTNNGLTENTPFKTIEKFLEITANAGYTDCRCIILKDGTYVLNKQALNNVTLHIKVDDNVNGSVILQGNYNVPEDWIMYNAHVKLTGTANAPIVYEPYSTKGIYFENSAVTLDYVKFNCRMQGFGCYIKADHIEANRLHFSGCTGYLADVAITNNSHVQHGIILDRGCNMRISGSFTVSALTAGNTSNPDKNYFLNIQDSDIVLQSSFPTTLVNGNSTIDITTDANRTAYSYAYGMRLSNAEITGTRIRLASYVSRGVNKTMLADEESDINVTWGGKKTGGESDGRAGFTSLYGYETATFTTPASDVTATGIKTWIIAKSTIDAAVQAAHPNVGSSSYPYDVVAVIPVSTSDNKIVFKNTEYIPTSDATNPGAIRVIVRNVTSTAIPAPSSTNPGATATINVIYTMKPFSVTYKG